MARVKQYPHFLFVVSSEESHQDEDGNWVTVPGATQMQCRCREETDGRGSEVQVAGGTFRRFTSLIQIPKGEKRIEAGTSVFVANDKDGTDVRIKGQVLKFDEGQLHSRLWL